MPAIDFDGVARAADMHTVARACGLEVNSRNKARCPFHDDRRPSMQIYPDGYHCFVCGAHGDAIDLVQGVRGCTKREAAEAVVRICGGELYVMDGAAERRITERELAEQRCDTASEVYQTAEVELARINAQIANLTPFSAVWVYLQGERNKWLKRLDSAEDRLIIARLRYGELKSR